MSNPARANPRDGDATAVRPPVNDAAAALQERIRAIRENTVHMPEGASEFDFPLEFIPPGWRYEWKARLINNMENTNHMMGVIAKGWQPVPASRHPTLMPAGYTGNTIEKKGQILMEIPKIIHDEMVNKRLSEASRVMRDKAESIGEAPAGTMARDPSVTGVVSKFESPAIPED